MDKHGFRKRGARIALERELGRLPLIEAERHFRLHIGRKTPQAFFWVEWDPLEGAPALRDAVLVMAERRSPRPQTEGRRGRR